MSAPEFLNRLRLVRSLIPPGLYAPENSVSPGLLEKAYTSADVWLDPVFVDGVDAGEFDFLDAADRERLARALSELVRLAAETPTGQGPTPDQRKRSLDQLVTVIDVLQPVPIPDKNLIAALWTLEDKYPKYVLGFDCRFGNDWSGDPGVWVTVVVPDEIEVESEPFTRFIDDVTRTAQIWLDQVKLPHWPYTRLITPSDIRDQIAEVVE